MKNFLKIILTILFFSTFPSILEAANISMQVQMPRGKRGIGVGDTFWISIQLTDVDGKMNQPKSVEGAKIVYFAQTGHSSSSSWTNGKSSHTSSYIYTMTLKAEKEGTFNFGPITVGGVKSNTISYTIGKAESNPSPANNSSTQSNGQNGPVYIGKGDDKLFLKASISKTSAYEQEALVYTIRLYSSYAGVKFAGATTNPTFDGFVIEESKINTIQMDYETYNGKTYAVADIARYIIFPQVTGNLKILGNTYSISVNSHEYYSDPVWGQMTLNRPVNLNVKPNDLVINVKPLPTPKPINFSGGVGEFSIESDIKNTNLKTNQAASVIYNISGKGNLKYIKLPDLNNIFPTQLEVYSPSTKENISVDGNNTSGSISFDYSFMPLETGEYNIPSVELVYFNPTSEKYETKTTKSIKIKVDKGEVSSKSQAKDNITFDYKLVQTNIVKNNKNLIVDNLSYWLWYIIPIIILIVTLFIYRRHLNSISDLELLKSKKANKVARQRLKKAYNCLQKESTDKFYDEMLLSIWGYIGDKLRIPISDLNRDNIRQKLSDVGVTNEDLDSLISLIDECEFAKYSSSSSQISMMTIYSHGCEVINKLENTLKSKVK